MRTCPWLNNSCNNYLSHTHTQRLQLKLEPRVWCGGHNSPKWNTQQLFKIRPRINFLYSFLVSQKKKKWLVTIIEYLSHSYHIVCPSCPFSPSFSLITSVNCLPQSYTFNHLPSFLSIYLQIFESTSYTIYKKPTLHYYNFSYAYSILTEIYLRLEQKLFYISISEI